MTYDAVLLLSFGGPEGPADVMPFLERVTRGRGIPKERLDEVARHYLARGGVSPLPAQCRALREALEGALASQGTPLPVYLGHRNGPPYVEDTLRAMREAGVQRALAVLTSAYSSYSGCRQYREDVVRARAAVGEGAPEVEFVRAYFDHPGFVEAMVDGVRVAHARLAPELRAEAHLVCTAHSIPLAMARSCDYEAQLHEVVRLVGDDAMPGHARTLSYQSRSGPPQVPWLEPDVSARLRELAAAGVRAVVVAPVGFVSDHMEVVQDLDEQAHATARELGLAYERSATPGTHPRFVAGLAELVGDRLGAGRPRRHLGTLAPLAEACPDGCCPAPARPEPPPAR